MIGGQLLAWRMRLRDAGVERAENLERPAIEDVHDGSARNVKKSLVWRESCRPRLKGIFVIETNKLLGYEFALGCEHLNPLIAAIRHIHESVVRDIYIVGYHKLLKSLPDCAQGRTPFVLARCRLWRTCVQIQRLVAVCTPHAFELPGVCVINRNAAVAISV